MRMVRARTVLWLQRLVGETVRASRHMAWVVLGRGQWLGIADSVPASGNDPFLSGNPCHPSCGLCSVDVATHASDTSVGTRGSWGLWGFSVRLGEWDAYYIPSMATRGDVRRELRVHTTVTSARIVPCLRHGRAQDDSPGPLGVLRELPCNHVTRHVLTLLPGSACSLQVEYMCF